MPFGAEQTQYLPPPDAWVERITSGLATYYDNSADAAMREKFDAIARSGMGTFTSLKDRISSFVSAPRLNAAANHFFDASKAAVQMKLSQLYANRGYFITSLGTTLAQTALEAGLGAALVKVPGGKTIASYVGQKAFEDKFAEIQRDKLNDMRASLGQASDPRDTGAIYKSFVAPNEAKEAAGGAFDTYVNLGGLLATLGGAKPIQSWAEAVTFPERAFEARKLASQLNVQLVAVESYLACMRSHLTEVQKVVQQYRAQLAGTLRTGVQQTLQKAFMEGRGAGVKALTAAANKAGGVNRIGVMDFPPSAAHSDATGSIQDPATLLGACIANAAAQGIYAGFNDMYYRSRNLSPVRPGLPVREF